MTFGGDDRPTTAEILASFRRTLQESQAGEETSPPETSSVAASDLAPEFDDFELPAMFRKDRDDSSASSPAFANRLGAALQTPPAYAAEHFAQGELDIPSLTSVLPNMAADGASGIEPPPMLAPVGREPDAQEMDSSTASGVGASSIQDELPREMPSCRDRLVIRMGTPAAAARAVVSPAASKSPVVPRASVGGFNYLLGAGSVSPSGVPDRVAEIGQPVSADAEEPAGDAAAMTSVLSLMLRQWMDDNFSRAFADALRQSLQHDQRQS